MSPRGIGYPFTDSSPYHGKKRIRSTAAYCRLSDSFISNLIALPVLFRRFPRLRFLHLLASHHHPE